MSASSGSGTAYPYEAPEFTPVVATQYLVFCVMLLWYLVTMVCICFPFIVFVLPLTYLPFDTQILTTSPASSNSS
jgi:hypothetical protein